MACRTRRLPMPFRDTTPCKRQHLTPNLANPARCVFRGEAFPPGSGEMIRGGPAQLDTLRAQLLGALLFFDRQDLAREWRLAPEAAAELQLQEPHPALQVGAAAGSACWLQVACHMVRVLARFCSGCTSRARMHQQHCMRP